MEYPNFLTYASDWPGFIGADQLFFLFYSPCKQVVVLFFKNL